MPINIANAPEVSKKLDGAWCIPIYDNKALICLRTDGEWDFPGGTIDSGETAPQAAIRELEEEAGMSVGIESIRPIGVDIIDERYLSLFVVSINESQRDKMDLLVEEHTEARWISSISEIPENINPPTKAFKEAGWLDNLEEVLKGRAI